MELLLSVDELLEMQTTIGATPATTLLSKRAGCREAAEDTRTQTITKRRESE
jgi:hypothetical protein